MAYHGWQPFYTSILLECLNTSEYQALTEAKREYFRMIVSTGKISFQVGGIMYNAVMVTIFPEGTQTHASILARLTQVTP